MLLSEAFNTLNTVDFLELVNKVITSNQLAVADIDTLIVYKLRKLWIEHNSMDKYPCSSNVYTNTTNNTTSTTRIFYDSKEASTYLQDAIVELTKLGYVFVAHKVDTIGKKFIVSYTVTK
jgi:hypothetical protein